jgi:hypothetical protein
MNRHCERAPHSGARPATLWLSLRLGQSNWLFDFAPGGERAVVVGRLANAHVRLDRRGVAPVHFHFEREGDSIRLIPGYADELWLNGTRVRGAQLLESTSHLEFSGLRLEAHVFALDSELVSPVSTRNELARERGRRRVSLDIPDPMSATRVAFRAGMLASIAAEPVRSEAPSPQSAAEVTPAPTALRTEQLASEMQARERSEALLSGDFRIAAPTEPLSARTSEVIHIDSGPRRRRRRTLRSRFGAFALRALVSARTSLEHAFRYLFRVRRA